MFLSLHGYLAALLLEPFGGNIQGSRVPTASRGKAMLIRHVAAQNNQLHIADVIRTPQLVSASSGRSSPSVIPDCHVHGVGLYDKSCGMLRGKPSTSSRRGF